MKGGAGGEDGASLLAQQSYSGEVAHRALGRVSCAYLPLYLACGEEGRVFEQDEAETAR